MSNVIEATKKGLKRAADFFGIIEVGEAPHHSAPYLPPPKGSKEVGLVASNQPTSWKEEVDRRANKREGSELAYLQERFKPVPYERKKVFPK